MRVNLPLHVLAWWTLLCAVLHISWITCIGYWDWNGRETVAKAWLETDSATRPIAHWVSYLCFSLPKNVYLFIQKCFTYYASLRPTLIYGYCCLLFWTNQSWAIGLVISECTQQCFCLDYLVIIWGTGLFLRSFLVFTCLMLCLIWICRGWTATVNEWMNNGDPVVGKEYRSQCTLHCYALSTLSLI